jgi:hypothetical protein
MTDTFLSLTPFGNESNKPEAEETELVVGEVVETSLTQYIAQTYVLDESPPFGGLVKVRDRGGRCEIFGVVHHIATGGIDPGRRAVARGKSEQPARDEQVYSENPQLNRLLRTEFGVTVLGCRKINSAGEIGKMAYIFPDYPPPLHYGVSLCATSTLIEFTEESRYLRTLLEAKDAPVEELIAAVLRKGAEARGAWGRDWLVESGRYLARLLKEDYDRLRLILEKCEV